MDFEKKVAKRKFLKLAGHLTFLTLIGAHQAVAEAILEIVDGKSVFRIVATCSPTNSVWELQHSTNLTSWTTIATSNSVTGKITWDITKGKEKEFFRAKPVTVNIGILNGASYDVPLINGQTLYDAMASLASVIPSFTFESDLLALGRYLKKINGISQGGLGGLRWILFRNGVSTNKGSSQITPNEGDTFQWRLIQPI